MKKIALLLLFLTTSSVMATTSEKMSCFHTFTTDKILTVTLVGNKVMGIDYVGSYSPASSTSMEKSGTSFKLQSGHEYMKFDRVEVTRNRFGNFLRAYQDVELPSKGALFDRFVTYVCE